MQWNYDMSAAPKDRPILGLCDHNADPYHDDQNGRLTDYGCHVEALGRVEDGPHVLVWGGEDSEYDEWSGRTHHWPNWWFRFGSEFEEAANPIAWMEIPLPDANVEVTDEMLRAGQEAYERKLADMSSPWPTEEPGVGPLGYAFLAMLKEVGK